MLKFVPAVRLKELGKHTELVKYQSVSTRLNSVDTLVGECLARFLCDGECPALFIQIPDKDDEALPNMKWEQPYTVERLLAVLEIVKEIKPKRNISVFKLTPKVVMLIKTDFVDGDWSNFGYYVEGADGVSIPAWKLALE